MPNPVTIRDVDYPSDAAAARALGVTRQCIGSARAKGTLDRVGLGLNEGLAPKPIVWRGVRFGGRRQLAEHLGIAEHRVAYADTTGRLDDLDVGEPARKGRKGKSVEWRGLPFRTQKELADYLGVSPVVVCYAKRMGCVDALEMAADFRLDNPIPVCYG